VNLRNPRGKNPPILYKKITENSYIVGKRGRDWRGNMHLIYYDLPVGEIWGESKV